MKHDKKTMIIIGAIIIIGIIAFNLDFIKNIGGRSSDEAAYQFGEDMMMNPNNWVSPDSPEAQREASLSRSTTLNYGAVCSTSISVKQMISTSEPTPTPACMSSNGHSGVVVQIFDLTTGALVNEAKSLINGGPACATIPPTKTPGSYTTWRMDMYWCDMPTPGVPMTCSDTDGGMNPTIAGQAVRSDKPSEIWPDKCDSSIPDLLYERYCAPDRTIMTNNIKCSTAVGPGSICNSGRCTSPIKPDQCYDNDGTSIILKGSVNGIKNGTAYAFYDSCNSVNQVREYTCLNNITYTSSIITCPSKYTCSQGKCMTGQYYTCGVCDFGTVKCGDPPKGGVMICMDANKDGCTEWAYPTCTPLGGAPVYTY